MATIVLFGAPGAGKGTQSELLVKRGGFVQISTGDLFRLALKNETPLGQEARSYMDKGELVPDFLTIKLVEEALSRLQRRKIILDGFPRNISQADSLGELLVQRGMEVDKAVFLEVPSEVLISRLSGRRVCRSCGAVYHILSKPMKKMGICDSCGGEVVQRADDQAEAISTRLKIYEDSTAPLQQYYRALGKLVIVDGNRGTETIYGDIKSELSL